MYEDQPKWTHGKLVLKKRQDAPNPDSPFDDPVDALMPNDFPPESEEYNPFKYSYEMTIPELNMTIWVRFSIEANLDMSAPRDTIEFTDKGVSYRFPFFPPENRGTDPGDNYDGTLYAFYRGGERTLWMIPEIEKAVIMTPGKGAANVTPQVVRNFVTPEKLMDAIDAFHAEVAADPLAPKGLLTLLDDMTNGDERSAWDDREEDEDDEDEYDSELDEEDDEDSELDDEEDEEWDDGDDDEELVS